jgi:competence protein ComEA
MNSAEKRFLFLALFLFGLGWAARLLPQVGAGGLELALLPVASTTLSHLEESLEQPEHQRSLSVAEMPVVEKAVPQKAAPKFPIAINTANEAELCRIKGVGPSLAQKILDYRAQHGPFRSAKDLEKVKGIGKKKREAIEPFVVF